MTLDLFTSMALVLLVQLLALFVFDIKRVWAWLIAVAVAIATIIGSYRLAEDTSFLGFDFIKNVSVAIPILLYFLGNLLVAKKRLSAGGQRIFANIFLGVLALNCVEAVVSQALKSQGNLVSLANAAAGVVLFVLLVLRRGWSFDERGVLGFSDRWIAVLYVVWNVGFVSDCYAHSSLIMMSVITSNLLSIAYSLARGSFHFWFFARATTLFAHLFLMKFVAWNDPLVSATMGSLEVRITALILAGAAIVLAVRGRRL